jgi:hypothetical protein
MLFRQSIEITTDTYEAFLSISQQLNNDKLLSAFPTSLLSQHYQTVSAKLNVVFPIYIAKGFASTSRDAIFDEICKNLGRILFKTLCSILPNSHFRIHKYPKFDIENESAKFDFVFYHRSLTDRQSLFLFETI